MTDFFNEFNEKFHAKGFCVDKNCTFYERKEVKE